MGHKSTISARTERSRIAGNGPLRTFCAWQGGMGSNHLTGGTRPDWPSPNPCADYAPGGLPKLSTDTPQSSRTQRSPQTQQLGPARTGTTRVRQRTQRCSATVPHAPPRSPRTMAQALRPARSWTLAYRMPRAERALQRASLNFTARLPSSAAGPVQIVPCDVALIERLT